jgi:hypothetical protein
MTRDEAIATLWRTQENGGVRRPSLYAVVGAAADQRIHPKLVEMQDEMEVACLYKGETAEALATVAPYLVRLNPDLKFFDWWWETGWGKAWGIFAWSVASFETVYEHFRRHTKVRTEDGQVLIFRFYDPRVLTDVWSVLTPDQHRDLLGPAAWLAAEDAERLTLFGSGSDGSAAAQSR